MFSLEAVVSEKRTFTKELYNFCATREIPCHIVENHEPLQFIEADVAISYGFGIIFKKSDIENFPYGIWNIHSGDLKRFRGRQPTGWAIIENEKNVTVTMYKIIDENIDLGEVLSKITIPLLSYDTDVSINKKIQDEVLYPLICSAIDNNQKGNTYFITEGRYLPSLKGKYDDIKSEDYSALQIMNLVRAKNHYGILVNGIKATRANIVMSELDHLYDRDRIVQSKDGFYVELL